MTETILGLLRHGQTDWNLALKLQGSSDIPLNETGRQQARTASQHIFQQDWDVVIASPLSRAKETAEIVAAEMGARVVLVPELIERSFGAAEGMLFQEWRKISETHEHIEGLESLEDLNIRCENILALIKNQYDGQRVLAVSHGALIRKLLSFVSSNEIPRDGDRLGNASLNKLTFMDGLWTISDYRPETLGT